MSELENNEEQSEQSQTENDGAADGAEVSEEAMAFDSDKARNNTPLLFVGLLMIGGGIIYFMHLRAGPSVAAASAETTTATETINQFLTDGDKNILAMREMLKNTEKIVQQFAKYPSVPDVELETNPFRLGKPKPEKPTEDEEAVRLKKLAAAKEAEKLEVLKAAQGLRVQSILAGKTPTCMINSKMYVQGQEVEGFTIERITTAGVLVKQKDYKFELRITKDF
jgi:hypothetical protein